MSWERAQLRTEIIMAAIVTSILPGVPALSQTLCSLKGHQALHSAEAWVLFLPSDMWVNRKALAMFFWLNQKPPKTS